VVGGPTRLAAFFGAFIMLLLYLGNWEAAHRFVNADLMYVLAVLSVAAFGAGRILGPDSIVGRYEVDGRPLVERYPALGYVLG
jgi:thiosulfate dehydrogenase [quinone] large subunit